MLCRHPISNNDPDPAKVIMLLFIVGTIVFASVLIVLKFL